ncbi:MAG: ABC transporter permease [Lachnospiraceae bacterium]|nr:ABC transporter permease [Lachnospiraceae bacterium]
MDRKLIVKRMLHSKFFMTGAIVAVFVVLVSVFSPLLANFDPTTNSLMGRLLPPGSDGHILGTDQLGRDIFSRLLLGSRYSLAISASVVATSAAIGTFLGLVSGYFGGKVDTLIMRISEIFLSIPQLILAIAIMAMLGTSIVNLLMVLIITSWTQYCKLVRNNVLVQKNMDYVHASQVMGAGKLHIMLTQIFPNVTTSLLIMISQQIGQIIMVEASLSFLGLGIQQPTPSWGNMIADGRTYLTTAPWMVIAPGAALMITVLAFNFLGDGLRDVFDPKRT